MDDFQQYVSDLLDKIDAKDFSQEQDSIKKKRAKPKLKQHQIFDLKTKKK